MSKRKKRLIAELQDEVIEKLSSLPDLWFVDATPVYVFKNFRSFRIFHNDTTYSYNIANFIREEMKKNRCSTALIPDVVTEQIKKSMRYKYNPYKEYEQFYDDNCEEV